MSTTVYTYNDKVLVNSANDKWLKKPTILPPISANTVRVRTSDGNAPIIDIYGTSYNTATLVEGTTDIYDVYKSGSSFMDLLYNSTNVTEVLGANITGITSTNNMFSGCTSLISVVLFDTSSVTNMGYMFQNCSSLTAVPLFNTANVTDMRYMFNGCTSVESGALALYNQASTQTTPPSRHDGCFMNCGSNTTTGYAELEQIPDDWK